MPIPGILAVGCEAFRGFQNRQHVPPEQSTFPHPLGEVRRDDNAILIYALSN